MTLRCPVCRAAVEQGPSCRRCKADLSMLFAIDCDRSYHLAAARRAARAGHWEEALDEAGEAEALRQGPDVAALQAAILLMDGDPAAAWQVYCSSVQSNG